MWFDIRSAIHIYIVSFQKLVIVLPLVKRGNIVATHNQDELVFRILLLQVREGINGVGWFWQAELNIGCLQERIILHGQSYKVQAVVIACERLSGFQRILRTDNEPDSVEIGLCGHVVGNNQVAGVNGIERAKKQSYFHGY